MSKVFNLDSIAEQTYQFQLDGKLINVKQPSVKITKKFGAMAQVENADEIFDKQVELVTEILNNNTSSVKFTEDKVSDYPQAVLTAIINIITGAIKELDNDPNLESPSQQEG